MAATTMTITTTTTMAQLPSSPSANMKRTRIGTTSKLRRKIKRESNGGGGDDNNNNTTTEVFETDSPSTQPIVKDEMSYESMSSLCSRSSSSTEIYPQQEDDDMMAGDLSDDSVTTTSSWIVVQSGKSAHKSNLSLLVMDVDDDNNEHYRQESQAPNHAYAAWLLKAGCNVEMTNATTATTTHQAESSSATTPLQSTLSSLTSGISTTINPGVNDECPVCASPLVFTAFGDAVYCNKAGCSSHRYSICETTVECLSFGEDSMYFGTNQNKKTTNRAYKIESTILGRSNNGSAALGIATSQQQQRSKSSSIANTITSGSSGVETGRITMAASIGGEASPCESTTIPDYLSEGVMSYMRMCILHARQEYAKMLDPPRSYETEESMQHEEEEEKKPLMETITTPMTAAESKLLLLQQQTANFFIPSHDVLAGLVALCTPAQSNTNSIKAACVHYMKISDEAIENPSLIDFLPKMTITSASKRLATQYAEHLNIPGFSFQPASISPDDPISIYEVFAFGKSHAYKVIHSQKLTEVYCKLTGQPLPRTDPLTQQRTRQVYDQMRNYFVSHLAPPPKPSAAKSKSAAAAANAAKSPFDNDQDDDNDDDDEEEDSANMIWDYKYAWIKIYDLFGLEYMKQFVHVNVKVAKFVRLEQTFHTICRHLGYRFIPTPYPWQPSVVPVSVSSLTKMQRSLERQRAEQAQQAMWDSANENGKCGSFNDPTSLITLASTNVVTQSRYDAMVERKLLAQTIR